MSEDERIQQILQYVNDNFQQNLSLSALAEEMFISPSTLSRSFKKETGIYFVLSFRKNQIMSKANYLK
jgi:YesN/AraC family two-component response regulator